MINTLKIGINLAVVVVGAFCASQTAADEWDDLLGAETLAKLTAAAPANAPAKPSRPRKVLVLTESKSDLDRAAKSSGMKFVPHVSAPHCAKAVALAGKRTGAFEATITSDIRVLSDQGLKGYDAIVLANVYLEGKLYKVPRDMKGPDAATFAARRKALTAFVRGGGGLVGVHNATCEALGWGEYNAMIGATHSGHAWYAHTTTPVKLDDATSPLNAAFGGKGFEVRDDIYTFTGPYRRDKLHVLLSVDLSKAAGSMTADRYDDDYPVSWIRTCGQGRVFYTSLGENPATFRNKAFVSHLLAGVQYAIGDLKADASPGKPLPVKSAPPKMAGWTPLFNGRNLDAWAVKGNQKDHWVVADGLIRYDGKAGTLRTKDAFGDYRLRVDFRLPRKADSGVFVRDNKQLNIWTWSMGSGEMWEHRGRAKSDDERKQYIPKTREDRPVGEWNVFLITVRDDTVTVVLNGREVIMGAKLLGASKRSTIGLQRHGDPVEFKNIYIKPLDTGR